MTKKDLSRIGMAAVTAEFARRDPFGAVLVAQAAMRAAQRAYVERMGAKRREAALAAGEVPL